MAGPAGRDPTRSPTGSLRGPSARGMDPAGPSSEPACDAAPQGATPAAVAAGDTGSFTPGETEGFTPHTGLSGEPVVPGDAARAAVEALAARAAAPSDTRRAGGCAAPERLRSP